MQAPSPITKPGPGRVERAHRERRVDVLGDEPAHRAEAGEDQRGDRGLGAAREDDVGLAAPDRRGALADRGRAGRAGRDGREVRAGDAELDRDLAARGVDERRGDEERRDAVGAALEEDLLLLGDRRDAADRGADEDADPRRVELLDTRLVPGLLRGGDGEEDVAIHPPRLLGRDQRRGIEATHLAGDPDRELARVEALDEPDPAAARDGRLPGREGIEADRGDGAEGGDGDATHEAKSVDHPVRSRAWPTRPNAPPSSTRLVPFPPMEAELVRELPLGDGWAYEPKWDGFRGVLENVGGELRLWSRNGRPLLRYFPELQPLGELLPPRSAIDGEIVIDIDGAIDFDAMQTRLHPAESRIRRLSAEIPAQFIGFDVLLWEGIREWRAAVRRAPRGARARCGRLHAVAVGGRPATQALGVARRARGARPRRRRRQAARPAGRARRRAARSSR